MKKIQRKESDLAKKLKQFIEKNNNNFIRKNLSELQKGLDFSRRNKNKEESGLVIIELKRPKVEPEEKQVDERRTDEED